MSVEMQTLIRLEKLRDGISDVTKKEHNTITDGVQELADGCKSFDKLISGELAAVVNDRVTTVGKKCFFANTNIQSVDLPNVTTVQACAFFRCTNLTTVNMPLLVYAEYDGSEYNGGAFAQTGLVQVYFPNLETLGDHAFNSCASLKSANLPKVTEIPASAFYYCSSLTDFDFSKIVSVGSSAFHSTGLSSVNSETMTSIGNGAFTNNKSLKTVYLPNVTESAATAFSTCQALESLIMPKLEAIPRSFCYNATNLTYFDAPVATSIESSAFEGSGLKTLVLRSPTVCSLSNINAFRNITPNIYVPDNLVSAYKSATNWTSFASRIFPISNLEGTA